MLPKNAYRHFLFLHIACRILWSSDLATTHWSHANCLLNLFVPFAPTLYGEKCLIGNMHSLIHLADDVQNMNCPMSEITAYPFENTLGKIKKLLRHGKNPLAQVCRRLSEIATHEKKPEMPRKIRILRQLRPNNFGVVNVKRIKYKNSIITNKYPKNTVLLKVIVFFKLKVSTFPLMEMIILL